MDPNSFSVWVKSRLSKFLKFKVPKEMIQIIMNYDNKEELETYMCTLLDVTNEHHMKFMNELVSQKEKVPKNIKPPSESNHNNQSYINIQTKQMQQQQQQQKNQPKQQQNKKQAHQNQQATQQGDKTKKPQKKDSAPEKPTQTGKSSKELEGSSGKKKKKLTTLYDGSSDGSVLLEGRRRCNCEASKHKLVNNCLHCGRIVCKQEGSGPCFCCSNLVCSNEEKNILNTHSKQSDLLLQKLMDQEIPESEVNAELDQALEQRNRLLEYDKTSEQRTTVIDDESDYYSVNSVWLAQDERNKLRQKEEEMRARKHRSVRQKRYAIDFAGRQVKEVEFDDEIYDLNDADKMAILNKKFTASLTMNDSEDRLAPSVPMQPEFQENAVQKKYRSKGFSDETRFDDLTRIQDKEFLEISDMGFCLSMHQPWASLLVTGIKLHEGRSWYTHHRGRLWIAAAAKVPAENEVKKIENEYRFLRGEDTVFPSSYPTGCLLGCVNVTDCLSQEEYQVKYPDGESDSPFVLICRDPIALPFRFLVTGQHKIYRLDSKIHQAALKGVEKVAMF